MDVLNNLHLETERLDRADAHFFMYDTSFPDVVAIVVNDKDYTPENIKRLTEAGYSYAGKYPKQPKHHLFTIEVKKAEERLNMENK